MASARDLFCALRATLVVALIAAVSIAAVPAPASAAQLVDLRFDDTTPGVLVVEWTIDDAARSTLLWGTDTTYGRAAVKATPATTHRVEIIDAECGTTYHFAVVMVGPDAVVTNSAGHAHVTPECEPPGDPAPGMGVPEVEVGRDTAIVTWRSAAPGFGSIVYGRELPYDSVVTEPGELAVDVHRVKLEGLQCSTSYHFAAITRTVDGLFESSDDNVLTTTACQTFISDVGVDVGSTTATLSWTTAAFADSWVDVEAVGTFDTVAGTTHRVDLTDLSCATDYRYVLGATDPLGAEFSVSGEFSTPACDQTDPIPGLPGQDATPNNPTPAIADPVVELGETSLAVSWTTDVVTGGQVAWALIRDPAGVEPARTVLATPDAGVAHRVDIYELECGTDYSLRIEVISATGARVEQPLEASTLACGSGIEIDPPTTTDPEEPATPPLRVIHEKVADVSKTSATLVWVTDLPGTGVVRFDSVEAANDGLDRQVSSSVPGVSQRLVLNDLQCGTSYLYSISAISAAGVTTDAQPGEFRTNNCEGADLIDIDVRPSDTAVVVAWKTDVRADSLVIFGVDRTYGAAVYSPARTTDHQMVLNGLRCDTTYHLRVMSNTGSGAATYSADMSTTTQPCRSDPTDPGPGPIDPTDPGPGPTDPGPDPADPGPDPTDPGTDPGPDPTDPGPDPTDPGPATPLALTDVEVTAGLVTATVSWITDKPSIGAAEYGLSTAYGSRVDSTDQAMRHLVTIGGLSCSTTYHLRVFARASDGSAAASNDVSFGTQPCPDDTLRFVGVNAATDADRAVVLVTTSVEAAVRVRWGEGSSLTNAIGPTQPALVHSIELENLACGTTYGYQVEATTADRFANTTRLEFTTPQCRASG
ncbi:MAG: hypothetical protein KDB16_00490 [Acidimicrobiales bacterium]|nr:hypothetical protein [Acidimicrobiales bacterium]